VLDIFKVLCL
jgi:hypothetical protein